MNNMIRKFELHKIKTFILTLIFLASIPSNTHANDGSYIEIIGSPRVAVGKSNVTYRVQYNCDGNVGGSYFYIEDDGSTIYISDINTPIVIPRVPLSQEEYRVNAAIYYTKMVDGHLEPHFMSETLNVYVRKPIISAVRRGIDQDYTAESEVPIHWNIDNDDNSWNDLNPVGYDYLKTNPINEDDVYDDDLLSVKAYIRNSKLDATDCNLKIQVPSGIRIWKNQKKNGYWSLGGDTIEIKSCDILKWFTDNIKGTNFYVEWKANLDETRIAKMRFYCNDVEFGVFEYKGYACTAGRQPFPDEREEYESICNLKGCQWSILGGTQGFPVDINSISETVDPNFSVYGEHFVVTPNEPLAPNIYTLVPAIYNGYSCKCISMDTFGDHDLIFDIDYDADAFFQSSIWPQNFLKNDNVYLTATEVLYYTGPFAARAASNSERFHCFGSWAMFKSRFFAQPKILHRANQLEQNRLILHKYVLCPNVEPIE